MSDKRLLYLVNSYPEIYFDMNDIYDSHYNIPYGIKCTDCQLIDFSDIPEKIFIDDKYEKKKIDINLSISGNMFCTQTVKEIMCLLSPNAVNFHPIFLKKTNIQSKYFLGIIKNSYITAIEDIDIEKCKSCNTVIDWHPGSKSQLWSNTVYSKGEDIATSKNIIRWKENKRSILCKRDIYLSRRIVELFNAFSINKIYQTQLYLPISKKLTLQEAVNRNQISTDLKSKLIDIKKR